METLEDKFSIFLEDFHFRSEEVPFRPHIDIDGTYTVEEYRHISKKWWYDHTVCLGSFNDFTKEIVDPENNEFFPEGAVGVRVDGDFWNIAVFPYEYKNLSIQEIVKHVWPDKYNQAVFNEDVNHGKY